MNMSTTSEGNIEDGHRSPERTPTTDESEVPSGGEKDVIKASREPLEESEELYQAPYGDGNHPFGSFGTGSKIYHKPVKLSGRA
jgi:hypothetical protein